MSESSPLLGGEAGTSTSGRTVERPRNWKEAQNMGWKPPEYSNEDVRKEMQKGFLLKVYGLLSAQLAVTVLFCGLFMLVEPLKTFVLGNVWMVIVLFLVTIAIIIALFFLKNNYPWNIYLLGAFTIAEAWLVGTVCAAYAAAGLGELVAIAWAITLFVFAGLTIFVAFSDIDFSFLGLFLPVCLLVFVFWGLTAMIFGLRLGYVYAAIGALLFSAYIIYDTFNIMNNLGTDEYVIASIELYLDIINLFLMILSLLSGSEP